LSVELEYCTVKKAIIAAPFYSGESHCCKPGTALRPMTRGLERRLEADLVMRCRR
jgi:hypothetical protein